MIETIQSLTTLPNLHPALIHFPVALLITALLLDLACLVLCRQTWIDRAAATLYLLGALGAGAAFLSGRQAADSLIGVPAQVQPLIAAHSGMALYTLWVFAGLAVLRLVVMWGDRRFEHLRLSPLRLVVLAVALFGQSLLFQTADRGGALVYRHGLAVSEPLTKLTPPSESHTAAREQAGSSETRLTQTDDGTLVWSPLPTDADALGGLLTFALDAQKSAVAPAPPDPALRGLGLQVSGHALLLLPGTFTDVQVEAELELGEFEGVVGVAHHVTGPTSAGLFTVSTDGRARLTSIRGGQERVLDDGAVDPPRQSFVLAVSAVGSHLKGLVDGKTVTHGHIAPGTPGAAGLLLDGKGIVRVLSMRIVPLSEHH